jgi:hypothetical protein
VGSNLKANALKENIVLHLEKARLHLEYSFGKVKKIDIDSDSLGEEELETLESFSSRFARYSDIIVKRYFRALALERDPAYSGSVMDLINIAEKNGWIESGLVWRRIRELRNLAAHEYEPEDYRALYRELRHLTPDLLRVPLSL